MSPGYRMYCPGDGGGFPRSATHIAAADSVVAYPVFSPSITLSGVKALWIARSMPAIDLQAGES